MCEDRYCFLHLVNELGYYNLFETAILKSTSIESNRARAMAHVNRTYVASGANETHVALAINGTHVNSVNSDHVSLNYQKCQTNGILPF